MATGYILCLNDKTTCGGTIIGGNPNRRSHSRPVARMGDPVTCGKHEGTYRIIGGISFMKDTEGNSLKLIAGTLDSFSSCPCQAKFIVAKYPAMRYESRSGGSTTSGSSSDNNKIVSAIASVVATTVVPVFAKSVLRGTGNTDAGTADEPQANIGEMSFYQSVPSQPAP